MFEMLLLGIGSAGAIGGLYILYLAFFRPGTFLKPNLAKWQGAVAFLVGTAMLVYLFKPWQ